MNKILQSIEPVIQQAENVSINSEHLKDFCLHFSGLGQNPAPSYKTPKLNPDDKIQLHLVFNTVNFCYWGEPKWTISYQGKDIGGASGMKAALYRGLEEGYPVLDASYLETICDEDFARIVRGSSKIPLFQDRISFLRQLGSFLKKEYKGKATNLVYGVERNALELLDEVTTHLPIYSDTSEYNGKKVLFHKRAQLFVSDVIEILESKGEDFSRKGELTALADYKVPYVLRKEGILVYSPELARKVDNFQLIPAGSKQEIEIRAFTIESVGLMVKNLRDRFPKLTAVDLDYFLYLEGKKNSPNDKPHHRTLTTAY